MHDLLTQVYGYLRGIWRYKWIMIAAAWLITVSGWVYVHQMPDKYVSQARVYVDTSTILKPLLRGLAVETDVGRQLRLMTRILLSRPNLEKVARMTDLDLKARDEDQMDALVDSLAGWIRISPASRTEQNLYILSASHSNPQLAKRIVQSLLTIFVESTLGETRKDSDSAQRFLDAQIGDYEKRLQQAELRLKNFKGKHLGMMPGSAGGYYERLRATNEELQNAQLRLREAERRRDDLQRQIEDADLLEEEYEEFGAGALDAQSSFDVRIASLDEHLDQLLLRYTDEHPDVLAARDTLGLLKSKRKRELNSRSNSGGFGSADESPVMQQMRITLGEAEANVASIQARVEEFTRRVESQQQEVDRTLEVETEFQSLNRDYDVTLSNYNSLLSRRETARLSEQAGQSAENVQFRVIDPPYVPAEPSAPNRPLMYAGSMVVGLGIGAALALFIFMLRPTVDDRRALRELTGLPVLGSVSMIWTPEQISRRRFELGGFLAASLALVAVFSGVMVAEAFDVDMFGSLMALKDQL